MTEPAWPRARGRLRVEALALISVTTALRFYGFPRFLFANRPIDSWCACCHCRPERSGIRGLRLRADMRSSKVATGTTSLGRSKCQIPSAPRKFFSDVVSGIFRSLRMSDSPGYGYVNADPCAATSVKKVLRLMTTLVSHFTIFRFARRFARHGTYVRSASTTGNVADHAPPWS